MKDEPPKPIVTLKDLGLTAQGELEQEASRRAITFLKAKQIEIAKAWAALDKLESQYSQLCLMTLDEFAAKEPGYSLAKEVLVYGGPY